MNRGYIVHLRAMFEHFLWEMLDNYLRTAAPVDISLSNLRDKGHQRKLMAYFANLAGTSYPHIVGKWSPKLL